MNPFSAQSLSESDASNTSSSPLFPPPSQELLTSQLSFDSFFLFDSNNSVPQPSKHAWQLKRRAFTSEPDFDVFIKAQRTSRVIALDHDVDESQGQTTSGGVEGFSISTSSSLPDFFIELNRKEKTANESAISKINSDDHAAFFEVADRTMVGILASGCENDNSIRGGGDIEEPQGPPPNIVFTCSGLAPFVSAPSGDKKINIEQSVVEPGGTPPPVVYPNLSLSEETAQPKNIFEMTLEPVAKKQQPVQAGYAHHQDTSVMQK